MAVSALTIHSQREEVVDFTVPFYNEDSTVVIKVHAYVSKPTCGYSKLIRVKNLDF